MEIFRILRKYKLHHVAAEFGMTHQHEEETELLLLDGHEEEEVHAADLTAALEELGPCFIKMGQLLSTRPDLLPPHYIKALSRLQNTVKPVPSEKIVAIIESDLGPLHTVPRTAFPRPRQEDCRPPAPPAQKLLIFNGRYGLLDEKDHFFPFSR